MELEMMQYVHQAGGLVHSLSAPEGNLFWAVGMRHEIQAGADEDDVDCEYVGHCLGLLLRSGGWRLLRDAKGTAFGSFIQLCYAPRPHGLGLSRADLDLMLID
jgi:hypothetical protein